MALSTVSSVVLEDVAAENGDGVRWFQLYWPHDDDVCVSLLERAQAAGFTALVVTLDTWLLGWRPHDLDNGVPAVPAGRRPRQLLHRPGVLRGTGEAARTRTSRRPSLHWLPVFTGKDHTWADLAFLREHWDGPIVLKGIQHPDDARRAVDAGMEGVLVSNHGGRQVDGAIGALDALPGVVDAVGDRIEVLFDSGIRTGADIVKALALGARAVLVGRPWVYGLGLGGTDGVRHVLRGLLADLDLALGAVRQPASGDLRRDVC